MGKPPAAVDARRSYTMSRIHSHDTSIEVALRRALWREGVRYRKNDKRLPGTPDIAITKFQIAVFCDGEFWHGKDWIEKKHKLVGNRDYWVAKIERNMRRDQETAQKLAALGWTVLRFWGKEIHRNAAECVAEIQDAMFQARIDAYEDYEEYDESWEAPC